MRRLKQTYEEWKQCLFLENGQKFSKSFIQSRLDMMTKPEHPETQRFISAYGEAYTRRIVSYFKRALKELE